MFSVWVHFTSGARDGDGDGGSRAAGSQRSQEQLEPHTQALRASPTSQALRRKREAAEGSKREAVGTSAVARDNSAERKARRRPLRDCGDGRGGHGRTAHGRSCGQARDDGGRDALPVQLLPSRLVLVGRNQFPKAVADRNKATRQKLKSVKQLQNYCFSDTYTI